MHYPPQNYDVNGLGFTGPPGAPTETASGIPIVSYTSRSGWAARPIHATGYYQPTIVATGAPLPPQYDSGLVPPQDYEGAVPFTYTREQLRDMMDREIASRGELLERQAREDGDGIATDLEQKAAEDAARARAIEAGAPVPGVAPGERPNWLPLVIGAALIYFMSG